MRNIVYNDTIIAKNAILGKNIRIFWGKMGVYTMKITDVKLGMISVPLRVPFKTALRTVNSVEDVVVEIHTDTGAIGYGEAPPTGVITGDTTGAIIGAIRDHIAKTIIGKDVDEFENLMMDVQKCVLKNTSAKAAVDMALWDLYGQLYKVPVYKMMGQTRHPLCCGLPMPRRHRRLPGFLSTWNQLTPGRGYVPAPDPRGR